jgi:diadenosine tetraphosphate (Ap4A) HIT family hydrolase
MSQSSPELPCVVCREIAGQIDVPGGVFYRQELVVGFHLPLFGESRTYPGHLLASPRRHVAGFGDLTRDEAAAVGLAMSALAGALREAGAARVYSATIGHNIDHLHVHLIARWPETPEDVPWHSVDEWPGSRREGPAGIASLVQQLSQAIGAP